MQISGEAHNLKRMMHIEACLWRNHRAGTEVSVKITCDVKQKRLFEKAFMYKKMEQQRKREERERGGERSDHVGVTMTSSSREDAHTTDSLIISGRRAHYG